MNGNTRLITGGGSGLGLALVEPFYAEGNQVIIAGRPKELLDAITAANPGMKSALLNTDDAQAIGRFASKLKADYPALNGVIHHARIMRPEAMLTGGADDAVATVVTNFLGPIRLPAARLLQLQSPPRASIITISSGLAVVPMAKPRVLCATKAAIHAYTQPLRYQLSDTAVEVLEIIPPYVQAELLGSAQAGDPHGMPRHDFIVEVMAILKTSPEQTESCVARVDPLLHAASNNYPATYEKLIEATAETRAAFKREQAAHQVAVACWKAPPQRR